MGRYILKGLPGFLGALLMWASQIGPDDAVSNLSKWAVKLGLNQVPAWLLNVKVDTAVFYIGLAMIVFSVGSFFFFRRGITTRNPKLPQTEEPAINIEVTNPANQASETWLEWLHVEVSPQLDSQVENLIASIKVDKRTHEMRWRGDSGPVEERTCRADRPGILPIALRSHIDTSIMGTQIQAGRCYITEINFQIHKVAAVRINTGAHRVFVIVRGREGQYAKREFRLIVPAEPYEPLRLKPVYTSGERRG